jgi:hypothetical protein
MEKLRENARRPAVLDGDRILGSAVIVAPE